MAAPRQLPLSGIRIIDFGHIVAGPFCVRLLADLGADVIKVETNTRLGRTGARRGPPKRSGSSGRTPHLSQINRNRRSIDLNLKTERGARIARQLADAADVVVENFSNGVMDRLGLGYADLVKTNPRIVYASMASFGHTGPRAGWIGMNVNLQAASGLMLATGEEGDPPIGISNSWNDYIGGLHAAVAIVGALSKRNKSGVGTYLDVSQFEGSVAMLGGLLFASGVTGKPPARTGNRSGLAAPQGTYRCAGNDQWCAISVQTDAQWQALVALLGERAAHLRGAACATVAGRHAQHDAIDEVIEAWTGALTPVEVEQSLKSVGVPAAAMRRGHDLAEVDTWQQVLKPIAGDSGIKVLGLPFDFQGVAPVAVTDAPRVGANGREVLRDWLNLDDATIEDLMHEEPA